MFIRFIRNISNLATILWMAVVIVWFSLTAWRVFSGTYLETGQASPTLIRLDLLHAIAFVVAWTALLLTITVQVVNKARDLDYDIRENEWSLEQSIKTSNQQMRKGDQQISKLGKKWGETASVLESELDVLKTYVDQLKKENKNLQRQLRNATSDADSQSTRISTSL